MTREKMIEEAVGRMELLNMGQGVIYEREAGDLLITDYPALVDAIGKSDDPNKAEVYEAVERQMQHLMDYVAAVYAQTTQMPMLRKIYQGQELRRGQRHWVRGAASRMTAQSGPVFIYRIIQP